MLKSNVEPRRLKDLLGKDWANSLPTPQSLISVVGGSITSGALADYKPLPAHKALEFSRGFAKAAQSTDSWVLTGGISKGAARLVGGALREAPEVACIGIAPWAHVEPTTKYELDSATDQQICTLAQGTAADPCAAGYHDRVLPDAPATTTDGALEPRASHFLLVDGGTSKTEMGKAHELRRVVENLISPPQPGPGSRKRPSSGAAPTFAGDEGGFGAETKFSHNCPMVLVVLGGGVEVLLMC